MVEEIRSYAQNFEDVILWRALKGINNGFYIDIGAHDPVMGSVTKLFYENGWCGINVEPVSGVFERLAKDRDRDVNLKACIGSRDGEVTLYDVKPSGLATLDQEVASEYKRKGHEVKELRVPIYKLDSIFTLKNQEVHFLKVDVEGAEKEVLLGINFQYIRPWIVVVEATYPNMPKPTHNSWEYILEDAGYEFVYFDGLNRFYLATEKEYLKDSFTTPPNYFDHFNLDKSSFFCRELSKDIDQLNSTIGDLQSSSAILQDRVDLLLDNEKSLKARIEELESALQQKCSELSSVYGSRSWRLVRAIQLAKHQALALFDIKKVKARVRSSLKVIFKSRFAYKLANALRRLSPKLYGRLHRYIFLTVLEQSHAVDVASLSVNALNDRELQIYHKLKEAFLRQGKA